MREQPARANFRWRLRRNRLLALLACLLAIGQASVYGQARITFPTADTTVPITPPPGTSPIYGSAPADGGAVPSPSNTMTPFGPTAANNASPTLPNGGYGVAPAPGMIYTPGPTATLNGTVQPP